jgi:hypothetical protein
MSVPHSVKSHFCDLLTGSSKMAAFNRPTLYQIWQNQSDSRVGVSSDMTIPQKRVDCQCLKNDPRFLFYPRRPIKSTPHGNLWHWDWLQTASSWYELRNRLAQLLSLLPASQVHSLFFSTCITDYMYGIESFFGGFAFFKEIFLSFPFGGSHRPRDGH